MLDAWIGFAGAIIGGAFTLVGVIITIRYYSRQENRLNKRQDRNGAIVFFRLISLKANDINKILIENESGNGGHIKSSEIISKEEKLFLFDRTQYLTEYLNDGQIDELINFICLLLEFESARQDCIATIGTGRCQMEMGVYFEILGDLRIKIKGNDMLDGIDNILCELKNKIC